jgi:hypothetical protein
MLIRETKLLCSILLSGCVTVMLCLPSTAFTGYSFVLDLNTRLCANDAYIGTYYFW